MRHGVKIAVIAGGTLLGVVLALALSFAFFLFTGPGNTLIEPLIAWSSDGKVQITGLTGSLPNVVHAKTIEIRDANGVWLRVEDVSLDWDALGALENRFVVHSVSASKIALLRRPVEEESESSSAPQIDIESFDLPRIEIAAPVAGHAAVLKASGALRYISWHDVHADMDVAQIGSAGRYRVHGGIADDVARGTATIAEGADGILGTLLEMPGLGPIDLSAAASGDSSANHIIIAATAGASQAKGSGTIALAQRRADIDIHATAPAMQPSSDLGWKSLSLDGHLHGAFDAPRLNGHLSVQDAAVSGMHIAAFNAQVNGDRGTVDLSGTAEGLRIPGDHPDLFAQAPVALKAHADLRAATKRIVFNISHPLLSAEGHAELDERTKFTTTVTLPSLEPFARTEGEDLRGHASVKIEAEQQKDQSQLTIMGQLDTQGASLIARVLGRDASFVVHATTRGADINQSDAKIVGAVLDFRASGALRAKRLEYGVNVKLLDISKFSSALIGNATLSGRIQGPLDAATTDISGSAQLASRGFKPQRINLTAKAKGFPRFSSGTLRIAGSLNGAPVSVHADLAGDKTKVAAKGSVAWKSLRADGDFAFPARQKPGGKARIDIGQLADLAPLLAMDLKGSLASTVALGARGDKELATLHAQVSRAEVSHVNAEAATIVGSVADPFGAPSLMLDVSAQRVSASGTSGDVKAKLSGPLQNLSITTHASLDDLPNHPADISAGGLLDVNEQRLALEHFTAQWRGQTATLMAPTTIDFVQGVKIGHTTIKAGGGEVRLSGQITPVLNASATVSGVGAKILEPFASTPLDGMLSANATLSGTLNEPKGRITLQAHNIIARAYFPRMPVSIEAQGTLHGKGVTLDAKLSAGSAQFTLEGEAPLRMDAPMNIRAQGNTDLTFLDPFLVAEGRRLHGALSIDADIGGTLAAPRLSGSGALKNGELQDFALGAHLRAIDATFTGAGQSLHITRLSARAGTGIIDGSGEIDFATPGIPLDMTLQLQKARPVVSDRLTADLSGNIHVSGKLAQTLTVAGKLDVSHATINIPDRFPPEVAVLDVRRQNETPLPAASGGSIALDVALSTSGPIFIRGRGIDADMGGALRLGGTIAAPFATGSFDMNRGTLALAGQTLIFTTGKLGFDGSGLRNGIDPSLNLVAQTSSGGVAATLTVTGHASKPQIVLSSTPSLPQDEVLAHLFFQQGAKQLTALQLAQIAQAIASLGGVGTGFDPLAASRRGLKLDRLSVGSTSGGASGSTSQTTIEGGKYVARNVYVGAKQSLSGSTQVQVQVDLTKQLKAQATVANGTNATSTTGSAARDNGSSVGLTYEFEY